MQLNDIAKEFREELLLNNTFELFKEPIIATFFHGGNELVPLRHTKAIEDFE